MHCVTILFNAGLWDHRWCWLWFGARALHSPRTDESSATVCDWFATAFATRSWSQSMSSSAMNMSRSFDSDSNVNWLSDSRATSTFGQRQPSGRHNATLGAAYGALGRYNFRYSAPRGAIIPQFVFQGVSLGLLGSYSNHVYDFYFLANPGIFSLFWALLVLCIKLVNLYFKGFLCAVWAHIQTTCTIFNFLANSSVFSLFWALLVLRVKYSIWISRGFFGPFGLIFEPLAQLQKF